MIKKHAKMADAELNEEERAEFFMQYFEEFEGFDEFDIAENIEIACGIVDNTR